MPEDPEEVASCFECCPLKDLLASYVKLKSEFGHVAYVFKAVCGIRVELCFVETEDISISGFGPIFYQQ